MNSSTMPSDDLLLYFANEFSIINHWRVNGTNYEKTSNGWLNYLDQSWKSGELKPVLATAYGEGREREWYINWRLFFLACAEVRLLPFFAVCLFVCFLFFLLFFCLFFLLLWILTSFVVH
jgi:cyclopropane fatty-acyl-phospholipid synthase-like methyltransferase